MPDMDEKEARRRFVAARVARLATVDPEGRPHLVPRLRGARRRDRHRGRPQTQEVAAAAAAAQHRRPPPPCACSSMPTTRTGSDCGGYGRTATPGFCRPAHRTSTRRRSTCCARSTRAVPAAAAGRPGDRRHRPPLARLARHPGARHGALSHRRAPPATAPRRTRRCPPRARKMDVLPSGVDLRPGLSVGRSAKDDIRRRTPRGDRGPTSPRATTRSTARFPGTGTSLEHPCPRTPPPRRRRLSPRWRPTASSASPTRTARRRRSTCSESPSAVRTPSPPASSRGLPHPLRPLLLAGARGHPPRSRRRRPDPVPDGDVRPGQRHQQRGRLLRAPRCARPGRRLVPVPAHGRGVLLDLGVELRRRPGRRRAPAVRPGAQQPVVRGRVRALRLPGARGVRVRVPVHAVRQQDRGDFGDVLFLLGAIAFAGDFDPSYAGVFRPRPTRRRRRCSGPPSSARH